MNVDKNKLNGIGGWLLILALSIGYSLVQEIVFLYSFHMPKDLIDNLLPLVYFELAGNIAITVLLLFCSFLFIYEKRTFPKWYITTMLSLVVFNVVTSMAASDFIENTASFDKNTKQSLGYAFIWIAYLLGSKRVKATFVR